MHADGRKEGTTVCRAEELTQRLRKGSLESVDNEDYLRFCILEVPRQCKGRADGERERENEWFSTIFSDSVLKVNHIFLLKTTGQVIINKAGYET